MSVLTAYIVREIIKSSLVALVLLLILFNLATLSDELKDIGKGRYGLEEVFLYLAFTSPRVFYELIPFAALLGSLFVVGAMANNREIIAMRVAGQSIFWIIKSVMLAGVFLVLLAIIVGELIAPEAERNAQLIKTTALNNKVVINAKYGIWLRENNKYINIRKIQEKGLLQDIVIYEIDEQGHLLLMRQVGQAKFLGDQLWQLQDIKQTELAGKQIFASRYDQMEWQSSIDPDLLNVVVVKSENMSLYDLFMYISFLQENHQKSQSFELAFWSRLVNPLLTFVMLMVSIPFVVSIQRNVSVGERMMIGIIIAMGFNVFDKITGHMGLVYGLNPVLVVILPSILVFGGAVYAIRKMA